jgi:predicted metal-dependent phosphotriesterase family hydrolase
MSQGEEMIKDETEATGQSPLGMRHIEEDIIPDLTEEGVGNTEVTTEMLVNDVMKSNIEEHSKK